MVDLKLTQRSPRSPVGGSASVVPTECVVGPSGVVAASSAVPSASDTTSLSASERASVIDPARRRSLAASAASCASSPAPRAGPGSKTGPQLSQRRDNLHCRLDFCNQGLPRTAGTAHQKAAHMQARGPGAETVHKPDVALLAALLASCSAPVRSRLRPSDAGSRSPLGSRSLELAI